MKFHTPAGDRAFDIPDDWWAFAEMDRFSRNGAPYFPYDGERFPNAEVVAIEQIEPPQRSHGVDLFRKYKLVPVLLAFLSPDATLPPVEVTPTSVTGYRFQLLNGVHRYYAHVAVGFPLLPIIVRPTQLHAL